MVHSVTRGTRSSRNTYTIPLFIEHEGSDSPPGVGAVAGLTPDSNGCMAPAVLILGTGDRVGGHRHDRSRSGGSAEVEITEVVDGGTTSQWCSLYPFLVRTIAGPERTDHLTQLRVQPHIHH